MQTRAPGYPQAEEIQFEAVRKENINHRWGDVSPKICSGLTFFPFRFLDLSDHDKVWANAIREGEILRESWQHCSDAVMYDLSGPTSELVL